MRARARSSKRRNSRFHGSTSAAARPVLHKLADKYYSNSSLCCIANTRASLIPESLADASRDSNESARADRRRSLASPRGVSAFTCHGHTSVLRMAHIRRHQRHHQTSAWGDRDSRCLSSPSSSLLPSPCLCLCFSKRAARGIFGMHAMQPR